FKKPNGWYWNIAANAGRSEPENDADYLFPLKSFVAIDPCRRFGLVGVPDHVEVQQPGGAVLGLDGCVREVPRAVRDIRGSWASALFASCTRSRAVPTGV